MRTLENAIKEAAIEVIQHCENSMDDLSEASLEYMDGEYAVEIARLRKTDLKDSIIKKIIAGRMYEDPEILHDIAGDHIYDMAMEIKGEFGGDQTEIKKLIICEIKGRSKHHTPMIKAMDMLLALEK